MHFGLSFRLNVALTSYVEREKVVWVCIVNSKEQVKTFKAVDAEIKWLFKMPLIAFV